MNSYIEDCKKTESFPAIEGMSSDLVRLVHASFGMQTEAAEFTDQLKKHIFYGKPLDIVNLKEEIGDQLWYIAIVLDVLDSDFETEMARNIAKLKVRYPEKFTNEKAENRDLEAERKTLEAKSHSWGYKK